MFGFPNENVTPDETNMTNPITAQSSHPSGCISLPEAAVLAGTPSDPTALDLDAIRLPLAECRACSGTGLSDRALAFAEDPTAPTARERHVAACRLHDSELFCPECDGEGKVAAELETEGEVSPAEFLHYGLSVAGMVAAHRYPELLRVVGMALCRAAVAGPRVVDTVGFEADKAVA